MAQLDALPYRMYLLAYDVTKHGLFDRTRTAFVAKAAVLAELALRGNLTAGRHPAVTGPGSGGDPVLDSARAEIQRHHRSWTALIKSDHRRTLDRIEAELESAAVITVRRGRLLGFVPRRAIDLNDPGAVTQAQGQFADVLRGGTAVGDVAIADAALVALAASGRVRTAISRQQQRSQAARIEALTARFAAAAPDLAKAVRRLDRMVVAAQGGMAG